MNGLREGKGRREGLRWRWARVQRARDRRGIECMGIDGAGHHLHMTVRIEQER